MADAFWTDLWSAAAVGHELTSSSGPDTINSTSSSNASGAPAEIVVELNQCRRAVSSLCKKCSGFLVTEAFSVAWAAHSLVQAKDTARATAMMPGKRLISGTAKNGGTSKSEASSTFSWKHRLVCILLLEQVCDITCSIAGKKSTSPFFPLLVNDSLDSLRITAEQPVSNIDAVHEQEILLDTIESLLPDILDDPVKTKEVMQALAEGGPFDDNLQSTLQTAVRAWTNVYHDDSYISPLIDCPPEHKKDLDDLVRAYDSFAGSTDPLDLLKPLPSVAVPFCRPLPPPLLPLWGYTEEEDEPLGESAQAQMLEHLQGELLWLTPSNLRLMLLPDDEDADKLSAQNYQQVLKLLQEQAFAKPLAPNEQRLVLQVLMETKQEDNGGQGGVGGTMTALAQLVKESGLTAQNLPRLVEHNPLVAYECLVSILVSAQEKTRNEYLSSLVGMDVSLHTLEVANRLATHHLAASNNKDKAAGAAATSQGNLTSNTAKSNSSKHASNRSRSAISSTSTPLLHPEYLHLFIGSCIASCENMQDRMAQNRLVRLVCIFCQSLLRHGIVQVEDIFFEVQSFCIEFSRIREAAALYKSLKEGAK